VKPYYEDKYCTIYHGDCREVLPSLEPVELVLTDPPYGMDYQSARRIDSERHAKIAGDKEFPLWIFEALKPTNALFVWCRWDNLRNMPPPRSLIVWDNGAHSMGDLRHEFGRQWEACAFYPGPEHTFKYRPVDIIRAPRVPSLSLRHPAEKPTAAITPLLQSHDGRVLDPFMGSGTTLRAAKDLGRKAIGIEIEEKYCEIAAKRLSQEVFDFRVSDCKP
jgi:site-specific DNA-methyltransferase (adenine-specific)